MTNHFVIVPETDVESYIARGYRRSETPAEAFKQLHWPVLSLAELQGLVVLEIEPEEHARLNDLHPKKFRIYFGGEITGFDGAELAKVRVLTEDDEDLGTLIAREDRDSAPERVGSHILFDTAREAVEESREFIRLTIDRMRRGADKLEAFLKKMEAL